MYGITVPNTEPSINDSYSMLSSSSSLLYFEAYSSIYKFVRLKELLHLSIDSFGPGGGDFCTLNCYENVLRANRNKYKS